MPFNKIYLDSEADIKLQNIIAMYSTVESALVLLPDSREKMLAITNLEQSFLWLVRSIEREQLERNFRQGHAVPKSAIPEQKTNLSPEASILAESKVKLESLAESIKELTNSAALTGFSFKR